MKIFIKITVVFLATFTMQSQVPNNMSVPYSIANNIQLNQDSISTLNFEKPVEDIKNSVGKDIYAVDIHTNLDLVALGTKIELDNGKLLTLLHIKVNEAKSLNFSFKELNISPSSKMYIYSPDKKQVMGPITRINNRKNFNTHILLTDEVIIEIISEKK